MLYSKISFLLGVILLSCSHKPAHGIQKAYIVYMGAHSHGPEITNHDLQKASESHFEILGSYLGSKVKAIDSIFYSYRRYINGFAAVLDEDQAAELANHPDVISVFPNGERRLHTTHSWKFLSLENDNGFPPDSLWNKAKFGENIIIGNLDTGVWPESASFNDSGYGPIPSKWRGICQNDTQAHFICNRKLIGGRYFYQGYLKGSSHFDFNNSMNSARDLDGHGSHTLSTAGGNFVANVSIFGLGNGTAKGGSPRARVAAYKVCWPTPKGDSVCTDADILQAFDDAIYDGVDVISASLGSPPHDYSVDATSIGAFHAIRNGIPVVCSAGNNGPKNGTVSNVSPWIFTVGASTTDRQFQSLVELNNSFTFKGESTSPPLPEHKLYSLISASDAASANAPASDALLCKKGSLDGTKVKGKILVCVRGDSSRTSKGEQALEAGAVGMILCNDVANANDLVADPHVLPASHIGYNDSLALFAYLNSTKNPMGYIRPPTAEFGIKPSPLVLGFSSKGPNIVTPEILKPDIVAPGVNIIAAYSMEASPTGEVFDKRRIPYGLESGTSMACPHVSGVVALLKALHPSWSPAAIRSALMTTATTIDNSGSSIQGASLASATPFDYGAGHIQPDAASDPGLVYDLDVSDYLNFLCAIKYNQKKISLFYGKPYQCPNPANFSLLNFNYPSVTVPKLLGSVTVSRSVKNVGSPGNYTSKIQVPPGISATVEPSSLQFRRVGEVKSFDLTLRTVNSSIPKSYTFGELLWTDGSHNVKSPIVVFPF